MKPQILIHTLTREDASYWLGFFRSFATAFWTVSELVLLPLLLYFVGVGTGIQFLLFLILLFAGIVVVPLALTSHIMTRSYLTYHLPRTIRLCRSVKTLSVQCPSFKESVEISQCSWAIGCSLQDAIGELLANQQAILIKLPYADDSLEPLVVAIPHSSGFDEWLEAIAAYNAPKFSPEPVAKQIKKPPLGVRTISRGISIGFIVAFLVSCLLDRLFGMPFWTFSIYSLSIVTSLQAYGIYAAYTRRIPLTGQAMRRILHVIPVIFLGVGIIVVHQQPMQFIEKIFVVSLHFGIGVMLASACIWFWRALEKL